MNPYLIYRQAGGSLSFNLWELSGRPNRPLIDEQAFVDYKNAGGGESYVTWVNAGKPTITIEEDTDIVEDGDGEEDDFSSQLAAAVAAWQEQQRRMGELQMAEVGRRGARDIGKLSYENRQALLSRGYTPAEIDQLLAGGEEAGFRSIYDIQKEMGLGLQQQLAQSQQFGIGTMISGEQLGQRQREMAMAGGQFQQSLAEQVRQFNLAQQQQGGQWQQQFGQRSDQFSQLMAQRRAEQPAWWEAPLSSFAGGLGAGVSAWALGNV